MVNKKRFLRCRVKNCFNSTTNNGSASEFFTFPEDKEQRSLWAQVLGGDVNVTREAVVCSDHFLKEDVSIGEVGYVLKAGSVPYPYTKCSVYGCFNFNNEESPFKFWSFPPSQNTAQKWKIFTQINNFQPTRSSTLCSAHFSSRQYNTFGEHLKFDALPDIPIFLNFEFDTTVENVNSAELVSTVLPSDYEVSGVLSCGAEPIITDDAEFEHLETSTENFEIQGFNEGDENVNQTEEVTVNEESAAPTQMDINNKLWVVDSIIEMGTNSVSSHANQKNPSEESSLSYSRISSKIKARQQSTKIRTLQQKVRRQTKQIESMKTLISVLKNRLLHCTCEIVDL